MRAEAAEVLNPRGTLLVEGGAVSPDAEAGEDETGAHLHEDQAVDLVDGLAEAALEDADEEGEEEDAVCVEGARDLGSEEDVGEVGGEPGEVYAEPDAKAVVI